MSDASLNELIEVVCESVVLTDPEDLAALAEMHTSLEQVVARLGNEDARLRDLACEAVKALDSMMLREFDDLWTGLATLSSHVAALQQVIVHGREIDEILDEHAAAQASSESEAAQTPKDDDFSVLAVEAEADPESVVPAAPEPEASEAAAAPIAEAIASPAETAPAAAPSSMPLTGDTELLIDFVGESHEHLDNAEAALLILEGTPGDDESINAVFRAFHTIKGVAGFLELVPVQTLAHEAETLLDLCRKDQLELAGEVLQLVFEATDVMKRQVEAVEKALAGDMVLHDDPASAGLIVRLVAACKGEPVPAAAPVAAPSTQATQVAEPSTVSGTATPSPDASSDADADPDVDAPADTGAKQPRGGARVKETVRVDADRLDKLIDIIGEMVIAEAMVNQATTGESTDGAEDVGRKMNHLDKITRELQELAMSLRMVPIRSAFQRMSRLVRDLAKKMNKPVEFITAGEETELDKSVVDAIGDPLVHMVRNAIDHGIEASQDDRVKAGKPAVGTVKLRAFHQGGSIYIEIADDGRGLDREVILAKARERGLIQEGANLKDSEIFALIFEPGFSTAKEITDVSGRGVGMDVVKRNIQALRGKIEISSTPGEGSVFSIRLPLTLAIIEGMVVRINDDRFIIPTLSIVRMIRPGEEDVRTVFERGEMLRIDGHLVPLYRINRLFGIPGGETDPQNAAVVVVEHDDRQFAFVVDELLGQQQIVIKPLGPYLRKYEGFSGGAIMPDGLVALILDIAKVQSLADMRPLTRAA